MNEAIKQFLENFLTVEEKKAQVQKRLEHYNNELKEWEEALNALETEEIESILDGMVEVSK